MSGKLKWIALLIILILAALVLSRSASTPSEDTVKDNTSGDAQSEGVSEDPSGLVLDSEGDESKFFMEDDGVIVEADAQAMSALSGTYDENSF